MIFKKSKIATQYLTGLKGIEIGGSAHNQFGLNTINVDYTNSTETIFKRAEMEMAGFMLPVDVVAPGDKLPFPDKSYDFVLSSHVIEHFYDPIRTINEWQRVATKYIYMVVPHRDRTNDKNKPLTTLSELITRHAEAPEPHSDKHWSFWVPENFTELINYLGFKIELIQDPDDKVNNGFIVILKID